MKWRLALRIASHSEARWTKKKSEKRNLGLSIETKTSRVGRPKKSWEDDINQVAKPDDSEATRGSELKNNDAWLKAAEDQKRWKETEKYYIKSSQSSAT